MCPERRRQIFYILIWLGLWAVLAAAVDNSILLAGPADTFRTFLADMGRGEFWRAAGMSLARIGLGFAGGLGTGLLLAALASCCRPVREFLAPLVTVLKTVPVASFVVLLLIWRGSSFLSTAISFLVVLPNSYINTLEGIDSIDRKMLEMARLYRICAKDSFLYIYRPALRPFWDSALKLSLGMCWKSGVAAEVIGTPDFSIGEQMYLSKIHLDTAQLLSWTCVTVTLSILFAKGVFWLYRKGMSWQPQSLRTKSFLQKTAASPMAAQSDGKGTEDAVALAGSLCFQNLKKSYDSQTVIDALTGRVAAGSLVILTGSSGNGKTTLLRLIAGLERPDSGELQVNGRVVLLFQEDRLSEDYSAYCNVGMVCKDEQQMKRQLESLLPKESLTKPLRQLSGGMKRRVALIRTLLTEAEIYLLDEPFAGLDQENTARAFAAIRRLCAGKTVFLAVHEEDELKELLTQEELGRCRLIRL